MDQSIIKRKTNKNIANHQPLTRLTGTGNGPTTDWRANVRQGVEGYGGWGFYRFLYIFKWWLPSVFMLTSSRPSPTSLLLSSWMFTKFSIAKRKLWLKISDEHSPKCGQCSSLMKPKGLDDSIPNSLFWSRNRLMPDICQFLGHHRTITNLSYAQVDADKSGAIEFDEFVLMMAKRLNSNIWSQIPTFDIDISSWANYWQNQSNNQIAHKSPNTI